MGVVEAQGDPARAARPDAYATDGRRRLLVVVKNMPWVRQSELDHWPPHWLMATVQHELAVTGLPGALVGVLLAGGTLRVGQLGADPEWAASVRQAAHDMVKALEDGVPPPAAGHVSDLPAVKALWPDDDGRGIALGPGAAGLWERVKAARGKRAAWDRVAKAGEARLRAMIQQHREARLPGGRRLQLRAERRGGRSVRRLVEAPTANAR